LRSILHKSDIDIAHGIVTLACIRHVVAGQLSR